MSPAGIEVHGKIGRRQKLKTLCENYPFGIYKLFLFSLSCFCTEVAIEYTLNYTNGSKLSYFK